MENISRCSSSAASSCQWILSLDKARLLRGRYLSIRRTCRVDQRASLAACPLHGKGCRGFSRRGAHMRGCASRSMPIEAYGRWLVRHQRAAPQVALDCRHCAVASARSAPRKAPPAPSKLNTLHVRSRHTRAQHIDPQSIASRDDQSRVRANSAPDTSIIRSLSGAEYLALARCRFSPRWRGAASPGDRGVSVCRHDGMTACGTCRRRRVDALRKWVSREPPGDADASGDRWIHE